MARRRKSRKYRRGRFVPLLRVLFFILVCAALAVAMTIFFKVEQITVGGNDRYTAEEVVDVSGIELGENMFMLNKYDVISRLTRELPYISTVQLRRRLPSTMAIEVTETQAVAAVESAKAWWLIGADGKLLEKTDSSGSLPRVTGTNPLLPTAPTLRRERSQTSGCWSCSPSLSRRVWRRSSWRSTAVIPIC